MKRIIPFLLAAALLLSGCFYSKKDLEEAYEAGWEDCLQTGKISEFDEYQHDNIISFFEDFCLDEFLAKDVDVVMCRLEADYQEAVLESAARIMEEVSPDPPPENIFVVNKNTMKFHKPNCSSVNDIEPQNRMDWEGTREDLIDKGYEPCQRCYP